MPVVRVVALLTKVQASAGEDLSAAVAVCVAEEDPTCSLGGFAEQGKKSLPTFIFKRAGMQTGNKLREGCDRDHAEYQPDDSTARVRERYPNGTGPEGAAAPQGTWLTSNSMLAREPILSANLNLRSKASSLLVNAPTSKSNEFSKFASKP